MKKIKQLWFLSLGAMFVVFLAIPLTGLAQETTVSPTKKDFPQGRNPEPVLNIEPTPKIKEVVNCFKYYDFGSVQVDVVPSVRSIVSGSSISFRGFIQNNNKYPIVNGSVYVKIFKKQKDNLNGGLLVDQFFALDNITLKANEKKAVNFDWKVPTYTLSGEYQAAMFFTSAKKFNLLGLSFTDDVLGNTVNFLVAGKSKGIVEFDKNKVKVNDKEYFFAAFTPKMKKDQAVTIKTILRNTTQKTQNIPIEWKIYSWDGLQEKNLIRAKKENVLVEPGEKEISLTVKDNQHPVYFIVVQAKFQDTKSILDIRFSRNNVNKARINFPAVASYPLKKGQSNTVFMCLHNSGTAVSTKNNKVILSVIDEDGKEISKYEYQGLITGAMMGLKKDFIPPRNYSSFTVKAQIYTNNKLVDQAQMKYDCQELDKKLCKKVPIVNDQKTQKTNSRLFIGLAILALIILIMVVILMIKKRNKKTPMVGLFLLLLLGGLFGASKTFAASQVVSENYDVDLCYQATADAWDNFYYKGLSNPGVNIQYDANIYDADTGKLIPPGSSVSVGTRLKFEGSLGDISWFGTGSTFDTPEGTWMKDAAFPDGPTYEYVNGYTFRGAQCSNKYFLKSISYDFVRGTWPIDIYIPFSVNPPTITLSRDASSKAKLSCSGNICTVLSPGAIKTDFVFASTYGNFYYEYSTNGGAFPGKHTSWDVIPMKQCGIYHRFGENYTKNSSWSASIPKITISYTVNAEASPSCTLNFSPSTITTPGSSTATWTSSNATSAKYSCTGPITGSGGWGSIGLNDSVPFDFTSSQTDIETCTITVKNSAGKEAKCSDSVTVNSNPGPSPGPSPGPKSCKLPWGETISSGSKTKAYKNASVPCGSTCQSQTRTCNDGTLSGSYTNKSCSVDTCPTPTPYSLSCNAWWDTSSLKTQSCPSKTWIDFNTFSSTGNFLVNLEVRVKCTGVSSYDTGWKNGQYFYPISWWFCGSGTETCTFYVRDPFSGDKKQCSDTLSFFAPAPTPINGSCGTASKAYPASATSFGNDTFCSSGVSVPPNPVFPSQGSSVVWTCISTNGGDSSTCTATHISACVPNSCAANTCIGQTCDDGCGNLLDGTKNCYNPWKEVAP